jgi:hypothetical protein
MALIYDELGNVIGEDGPSVDEMRYALSLPKTIQRMVTSPANDVSALSKAQTYKDIAGGFGSAGESLVRGAGAAALGLTGDIFKHFQETPFIPGVTDKITLSDMFPGADRLMPKQEQTYELPVRRQPNMSYPEPRAKQEIMGLPYATTSDILEAAPSRMTAPFGDKTANDFMETLGMFLQPSMQAGARQGIINMVEATGKVPSLTRDSAQAFARDYTNALNGVYPEAPTAGSMAADFARTGKKVAQNVGQAAGETIETMAQRRAAGEGAYANPLSPQSVMADIVAGPRSYAVRPTGSQGQVLREVPTELNPIYNVANEANLTLDLENILNRARPTKDLEIRTREQPFTNFVPDNFNKSANDLFKDFITPRLQAEFPGLQNEELLRAARVKYGDGLNNWMKSQLEDFSKTPEVQAYNVAAMSTVENDPERFSDRLDSLKDVMVVPPSVKLAGMQAADSWVMRNLQNYFVEHVGTESDPGLKEIIETGKSNLIPESQLEEYADDNARTATSFRNRAGMPVEGVVRPMLIAAKSELAQIEVQLQDLQNQFNDLVNANPGVRPTEIPGIKELYKEKQKLTKVKDKVVERSANLEKAILYEDYMDANVRPVKERSFVEDLQPINAQRFPMIPTNKEYMYQMNVPDPVAQLGRDVVSELELGLLTPEAAKSMSVPTAAKMRAELIAKREQSAEKLAQQNIEQLKSYIMQETQSLPQDGKYGKGVVVKFDNTLSKDQMQKAMSSETEWMDHCIGRAGSPDKNTLSRKAKALGKDNVSSDDKYVGYVPMLASHKPGRVVPRGSSGTSTSYMNDFLSGDGEGRSFRDDATGVPFATMKVKKLSTGPNTGKYSIGEFYGYKDRTVDGPWYEGKEGPYSLEERNEYRQVVADWANDHADQLAPTNNDDRRLIRFANIYDMQSPDHRGSLTALLGLPDDELGPIVDQIGKRFVTADEAKTAKRSMEVAPTTELGALKATKKDIERTLRHGGLDDEEEMVLRGQVRDLEDEIRQLEESATTQLRAAVDGAFVEYNSWLVDRHPTIQSRLDQLGDDISDIARGHMTANQFGLNEQEFDEFVRALGREQRNLINLRNAGIQNQVPANQQQAVPAQLLAPRDIADRVSAPAHQALPMRITQIEALTEAINNEIRSLPTTNDGARLQQAIEFYEDPNNLPDAITDNTHRYEDAEMIAAQIRAHAQSRLDNLQNQPQQIQAEPNAIQRITLQAAQNDAFGVLTPLLNQDARDLVERIAFDSGNDLGVIQANTMAQAQRIRNNEAYTHLGIASRGQLADALNAFARQIAPPPAQAPALRAQRVEDMALIDMTPNDFEELQGNIVQNLINQYPEPRQIQAVINDLEHGSYDELPMVVRQEMDEDQANSFVTQIIGDLERYRDTLPAERAQLPAIYNEDALNLPITEAYQAFIDEIASAIEEGSFDPNSYSNEDLAQMILDDQVGGDIGNLTPESRERLAREVREFGVDPYHEPEAPQRLPAPEAQRQYNTATQAFNGLVEANGNFMLPTPEEGLNTLRAVPQLLDRENLREHFGTTLLSQRQRQELEQQVNELIRQRTENILPPPEGRKRGGSIQSSKNRLLSPNTDEMRYALLKGK